MGAAFLITLREGLEAALIVAILLAYLNRIDRRDQHSRVWLGTGIAVAASVVAGLVIFAVAGELSHAAQEAFEGVATLFAVGVLTWMIFWMRRHAAAIKGELQGKVDVALDSGSETGLVLLAFFVVVREGLETALFLFSAFRAGEAAPALKFTGAVLGLALSLGIGYLFYRGGLKINLRTFFRVTGALLIVVAASLIRYGLHELLEAGWFDGLAGTFLLERAPAIGAISNVPSRILMGLKGHPNWLEFGAWLTYLVVAGVAFFRPTRPAVVPSQRVVEPQPRDAARAPSREPASDRPEREPTR